ncbi:MAG: hypothetical protein EA391_14600 [Balneolaceae bacterium]|nr:MAG: hypothetical protein EA391_14600 [Balneolaceae bacterium]
MEQIIENITQKLTSKLPKEHLFFTPSELLEAGYPSFLVNWMRAEAWEYAKESVSLTSSEWVNLKSEKAQQAQEQYLNQLETEVCIPEAHCAALTQNGVEICLDLAINPRKAIPEYIFEKQNELDLNELSERAARVTVNAHLALALERFIIKKDLLTLKFEKAKTVVEAIDARLTADYNPLKWAEELKPVFALTGNEADPDLMRQFFEDKGMPKVAAKFDIMAEPVSDADIIEVMSSVELLLDDEPADAAEPTLFKEQSDTDVKENEPLEETISETDEIADKEPSLNAIFSGGKEFADDDLDEEPVEKIYSESEAEELEKESETTSEEIEALDEDFPFSLEDDEPEPIGFTPDEQEADEPKLSLADNFITAEAEEGEAELDKEVESNQVYEEAEDDTDDEEIFGKESADVEDDDSENEEASLADIFYKEESGDVDESEEDTEPEPLPFILEDEDDPSDDDNQETTLADQFAAADEDDDSELSEEEDTPPFVLEDETESAEKEDSEPLLSKFTLDDDGENELPEFTIKPKTIYDELNLSNKGNEPGVTKSLFDFEEEQEETVPQNETDLFEKAEMESDESEEAEEVPMWKSFLERDDIEHEPSFVFDEQPMQIDEDIYPDEGDIDPEEPLIDLTKPEPVLTEKIEEISGWLNDDSERFIDEIFGGSDTAYDEALGNIMDFKTWKEAARYIEKEIFTRNMIDVYDEVAVDFTDRLHSYFTEFKT